jgi:glycosyltransferase involved in cell wall biosynthesis
MGGIESLCLHLARTAANWRFVFCFAGEASPAVREEFSRQENVTLEVMGQPGGLDLRGIPGFIGLLLRHRPSIFLYSFSGVVRLWPWLAYLLGVRTIVYNDQSSRTSAFRPSAAKRTLYRWLVYPVTASICVSDYVRRTELEEGILNASRICVVPSGVDLARASAGQKRGVHFRNNYGIPRDGVVGIQVSWLVPEKGIDKTLRAASRVMADHKNLYMIFVGDGDHRQIYQQLARELGIIERVRFVGMLHDPLGEGAFAAADFQIQASQWHEAFCLAVIEGMAAGLPVIATRIGGLPELVHEGENGRLVENDVDHVAHAIRELTEDHALRVSMGRASMKRSASYSIEDTAKEYLAVMGVPYHQSEGALTM